MLLHWGIFRLPEKRLSLVPLSAQRRHPLWPRPAPPEPQGRLALPCGFLRQILLDLCGLVDVILVVDIAILF